MHGKTGNLGSWNMHGTWTREGSILITFLFEVDEKEKYTLALTGWRYLGVLLLCVGM